MPSDSHLKVLESHITQKATIPYDEVLQQIKSSKKSSSLINLLDEFGFAIVTDVAAEWRLKELEDLWAEDLRSIVDESSKKEGLDELLADPIRQWPLKEASLGEQFVSDHGLPQGRLGWAVRTDPNVQTVFSGIFGTEELCVGCDNIFFQNKNSEVDDLKRVSNLWPHADQNKYNLPGGNYDCFQGILYIWPADVNTSATVIWPTSHKSYYSELMKNETRWLGKDHFCMMDEKDVPLFVTSGRRVPVPKGALLLWSSKTIHQGWPNGPRLAVPVCFEPKSLRSEEAHNSKKDCVLKGFPTTHWASLGISHFFHHKDAPEIIQTPSGLVLRCRAHSHIGSTIPDHILRVL